MKTLHAALLASVLAPATAFAQQTMAAPAAPPTAQQQAQISRQDAEMSRAAAQVIQMIDHDKASEVWDGASAVAKAQVARNAFIASIAKDRQQLGVPRARRQVAVTRHANPEGGQVPAGYYISVVHATTFANMQAPVRELVSFRLDDDKTWRVSGYSVR